MKRRVWVFALALACAVWMGGCAAQGAGRVGAAVSTSLPAASPTPEPAPKTVELRFSATGDNLIHDGIYLQAAQRAGGQGYDFTYCYQNVQGFYTQHDINWINQETLVNDELPPSTYPCFSTPGAMGHTLYDLGFRVFSLANNHTYDKGAQGLAATCSFWASMPADTVTCGLYAGQADYGNLALQQVQGVTIAYLAYTEHTNGLPTPQGAPANVVYTDQLDVMQHQIELAASQADLVVVSDHWGVEGSHAVTAGQRTLAQQQADWGADVIIGTHPHVVQGAEWLTAADGRQAFVAYSLGNFISAQSTPDTMIGAVLDFTIEKTTQPGGSQSIRVVDPLLHPVVTHYGPRYTNIRVYWYGDYTDELAAQHGVRGEYPQFSRDYIREVLCSSIPSDFLAI